MKTNIYETINDIWYEIERLGWRITHLGDDRVEPVWEGKREYPGEPYSAIAQLFPGRYYTGHGTTPLLALRKVLFKIEEE